MTARGPDPRALALQAETRALLELYDEQDRVARLFDELIRAQAQVQEQGEQPRQPRLDVLQHSWQARRGEAFWDRAPVEPAPLPELRSPDEVGYGA